MLKMIAGKGRYGLVPDVVVVASLLIIFREESSGIIGWVAVIAGISLLVLMQMKFARLHDRRKSDSRN